MPITPNKVADQEYTVTDQKIGDHFIRHKSFMNSYSNETYDSKGTLNSYEEVSPGESIEVIYSDDNLNQISEQSLYFETGFFICNTLIFKYNTAGQVQEIATLNKKNKKHGEQVSFVDDKPVRTYFKNGKEVTELTPNRFSNEPIPNLLAENAICPAPVIPDFKPKF